MQKPEETLLNFHCGVCTKHLTDATALFTSCGHFFCFDPEANCTSLRPDQESGRCEQCGKQCQAGNLANRGSRYDSRVRSFVFSELSKDLRTIAEIIEFRHKHLLILGENAAAQQKRINVLTAECKSRTEENQDLQRENKDLRLELSKQRRMKSSTTKFGSPEATRAYERKGESGITVIDLDPPGRSSIQQLRARRDTPQGRVRINRGTEPSTRTRIPPVQTYDRSLRTRSIRKRRESQLVGSRPRETRGTARECDGSITLKRPWVDRTGTEGVNGWSQARRKENVTRFGNPVGESRGTLRDDYKTRQRFVGDWQRKVSSVPRPSATPDKLRRHTKRADLNVNPLGKRY